MIKGTRDAGVLLVVLLGCGGGAAAQSLPAGFSDQTLLTGLSQPVGFTFLPDGRVVFTEQRTARVKVFAGGAVGTLGVVPNVNAGANERGLLGVDVDPRWPARPYLYFYYSHTVGGRSFMRLSLFKVSGRLTDPNSTSLTLGSAYAILTDIPDQRGNHNGGTCRFGPDGMLRVSIGDDASSCAAQSTTDLRGVILRVDVSKLPGPGSGPPPKSAIVPAGNPFSGPNDNARLTWSYGLRNPFRFNVDRVTGRLYIADVGLRRVEELDESVRGGENFGWPWREGPLRYTSCGGSEPPSVQPIAFYDRTSYRSASIIAMPRYRNRLGGVFNFGNNYEGDVFFAEYYQGFVRRIKFKGGAWKPAPAPGQPNASDWATGIRTLADARVGPGGALHYLQQFPGSLHRIVFTPKLPQILAGDTARAGQPFRVRSRRDPGDVMLVVLGLARIAPTPLPGFFGRVETLGFPIGLGVANASGNFDVLFASVPGAAVGLTVHFQSVAVAAGDSFLSGLKTVKVVS